MEILANQLFLDHKSTARSNLAILGDFLDLFCRFPNVCISSCIPKNNNTPNLNILIQIAFVRLMIYLMSGNSATLKIDFTDLRK